MKKYEWKLKAFAKGIDAELAVQEIERIEKVYGAITAQIILSESRKPDSILHPLFEWEDTVAAEHYRLQQARSIINNIQITVVKDGESKNIGAYEIVTGDTGRVYKNVSVMTVGDLEQVKLSIRRDLITLKNKAESFEDLQPMVMPLQQAIEFVSK